MKAGTLTLLTARYPGDVDIEYHEVRGGSVPAFGVSMRRGLAGNQFVLAVPGAAPQIINEGDFVLRWPGGKVTAVSPDTLEQLKALSLSYKGADNEPAQAGQS